MKTFEQSKVLHALPDQFFAKLGVKIKKASNEGRDLINLAQGNPDQPTPEHIVQALKEAADKPVNHKYSPFQGFPYVKEACAAFYEREYGVKVDPETEVALLFGGKAGLVELPQCLLNPGDVALVPDPGYPDYWSGIALAGAEMHMMPLKEENGFLPCYEDIPDDILDRAKLLFINYPNNPTGAMADLEFYNQTIEFANKHDICVVHDFAYGAIGFDGNKPVSYLEAEGAKETGLEIYTMSKTYNMAGWRIGFAIGNPSVISAIELLQDHLNVSLFGAIQEAAAAAFLGSQECVYAQSDTYESRRNVLIGGLREIGWEVSAPAGSFFSWLKVPKGYTSVEFSDLLLDKANVIVAPGIGFGEYGEGYVRVGLLASEERMREAIQRIKALNIF
ncbi:aminotransferase [Bacillus ectoiniformans]|uniref:pyridoxal phosphate-dependent aminotransferase n=1 Tax=Bacillus ectoiniformans TaxID=1494429 RepID=UPI00195DE1F6|nr:pyridoxal phosphate-dependent aminotransferase [Bacillus ectoiniformans]MBM7649577.1 aminotransferase [Bacillus ectoiniformans]